MTDDQKSTATLQGDGEDIILATEKASSDSRRNALLIVVGVLTAATGISAGLIAFFGADPLTEIQRSYYEKVLSVFMLGSMGLIGLLGGRALHDHGKG